MVAGVEQEAARDLWTGVLERWLRAQQFTLPGLQLADDVAYDNHAGHRGAAGPPGHRDRLMAAASEFTPVVTRLGCLRGVSTLTAFGLAVERGTGTG